MAIWVKPPSHLHKRKGEDGFILSDFKGTRNRDSCVVACSRSTERVMTFSLTWLNLDSGQRECSNLVRGAASLNRSETNWGGD